MKIFGVHAFQGLCYLVWVSRWGPMGTELLSDQSCLGLFRLWIPASTRGLEQVKSRCEDSMRKWTNDKRSGVHDVRRRRALGGRERERIKRSADKTRNRKALVSPKIKDLPGFQLVLQPVRLCSPAKCTSGVGSVWSWEQTVSLCVGSRGMCSWPVHAGNSPAGIQSMATHVGKKTCPILCPRA